MVVMRKDGVVTATGVASGVDDSEQHQCGDAINPRVVDHGSRCGVINAGLVAAPAGRVGLVDQRDVGAVALLQCAGVLLASARLERGAALAVVAGFKGATISLQKQSLADNAHGLRLISRFEDQHVLSGSALGADLGLASQHGASHVVGAVGAAEGGNSHGSWVGVEALASCPRILHHAPPSSTLRCRIA